MLFLPLSAKSKCPQNTHGGKALCDKGTIFFLLSRPPGPSGHNRAVHVCGICCTGGRDAVHATHMHNLVTALATCVASFKASAEQHQNTAKPVSPSRNHGPGFPALHQLVELCSFTPAEELFLHFHLVPEDLYTNSLQSITMGKKKKKKKQPNRVHKAYFISELSQPCWVRSY